MIYIEKPEDWTIEDTSDDDVIITLSRWEAEELQKSLEKFCVMGGMLEVQNAGQLNQALKDFFKKNPSEI